MRKFIQIFVQGCVVCGFIIVLSAQGLHAQLGKGLNSAVKSATTPAKDAQKLVRGASKPAKNASKTINTLTKAPQKVEKEYTKVGTEVKKTEQAYEKTGKQAEKAVGIDGKGEHKNDSAATKTADASKPAENPKSTEASKPTKGESTSLKADADHKSTVPPDYVPEKKAQPMVVAPVKTVDPMDIPPAIPPGSRDHKTASGPLMPSDATNPTVSGGTDIESDPMLTPDGLIINDDQGVSSSAESANSMDDANTMTASADPANSAAEDAAPRFVDLKNSPRSGEMRPKPDYSHSPARIALEKADFDVETLQDLFKYSNWEGPEREHTVRAVAQSLDELQASIVEVKKLDPGQSTWRFEESYKDMKAAYIAEMKH